MGFPDQRDIVYIRRTQRCLLETGQEVVLPIGRGGYFWVSPLSGEAFTIQEEARGGACSPLAEVWRPTELHRSNSEPESGERVLPAEAGYEDRRPLDEQGYNPIHSDGICKSELEALADGLTDEELDRFFATS